MTRTEPATVLFVAVPPTLGGSNRSLVTLLDTLGSRVHRVLAAPPGNFSRLVEERGGFDEFIPLPRVRGRGIARVVRIWASLKIARWAVRNRRRLTAIHGNATTGVNLAAPAAVLTGVPVVAWIHDPVGSRWGRVLGPILRTLLRRVRWTAVSATAAQVIVDNRVCRMADVIVVPNPIDPDEIRGSGRPPGEVVTVGFLGGSSHRKGFDLLPPIIEGLADLPVRWKLFINTKVTPDNQETWERLEAHRDIVEVPGRQPDVRPVYDKCDIVLVTSRQESFCRVAVEAMMNGIAVVGTDIEPLRVIVGDGDSGLLFPVDDVAAAVAALRKVIEDPALRRTLGEEGRRRSAQYAPPAIADRLLSLYVG